MKWNWADLCIDWLPCWWIEHDCWWSKDNFVEFDENSFLRGLEIGVDPQIQQFVFMDWC